MIDPSLDQRLQDDFQDLARQLTNASLPSDTPSHEVNAYNPEPGSNLDPRSPNFDARVWVKAVSRLAQGDHNAAPPRFLGVAFKNLSAYGSSSGSERQLTVLNAVPTALSYGASLLGAKRRGNRVEILRDLEGVIEQGELLLVLGPPGSGCSTFLKTLAGETAGFDISEESRLNYRGRSALHPR
jgi:ABC-type glutathione transport system ATPase component